ncbi:MAG: hypothetical protein J5983_04895 [Ruminococcus sp.]|nr:hypothetical protein [Ruminococcus sp.]
MTQKKKPHLKIVKSPGVEELKKRIKRYRKGKVQNIISLAIPIILAAVGTWMLMVNHPYDTIYRTASYKSETADNNQYAAFKTGIIRYNKDGVAFLNRKNEELWIQPSQFSTPVLDIGEDAFAIADIGGNTIQVFTKEGIKGEIETTLPIEKISVSGQGIVSVILKNEMSPVVMTYDATGNILIENQINVGNLGYPTAIEMSPDGTILAVAYLEVSTVPMKSKVVCYNFGEAGKDKQNKEVSVEEYADALIPELYFMGDSALVAVSDHSFIVYEGSDIPVKKKEVQIDQEIKSVFHTDKYIGFIMLNKDKSGYEAKLYNKSGAQLMSRGFTGEYSNVQMFDDEIIMFSNSHCCVITDTGVQRFSGDLKADALLVLPAAGMNKYLVMSANELRMVYLVK